MPMRSSANIYRLILGSGIGLLLLYTVFMTPKIPNSLQEHSRRWSPSVVETEREKVAETSEEDRSIKVAEHLHLNSKLGGFLFGDSGKYDEVSHNVTTCLIHSFSPDLENEAKKRFLDPANDNIYLANSPALLWYKSELVLVSRIWLDREVYEKHQNWPSNHFADNYFYTQKFDHYLRPTNEGEIMGMPSPKQWWVGDGPIEPRLFIVQDRLFVSLNLAMAFNHKQAMDFTVLWDYDKHMPIIPKIKGGTPMKNATEPKDMTRDKHWMAFTDKDNELYFVHSLDPLRIMHCTLEGACEFVHDGNNKGFVFRDHISHLRGGTPFELYEYPYYISVSHSTMYKDGTGKRLYTAHIVVLCVKPYRIVYVSNHILIHEDIYKSARMVRHMYIEDGFIFPVGIILENKDVLDIGVHVNDFNSVLIRLTGLKKIMDEVIRKDKEKNPSKGPEAGAIHSHIHEILEKLTGYHLADGKIYQQVGGKKT